MNAHRPVVLVIDDDDEVREMTAFVLSGEGFDVVDVDGGSAAIQLAKTRRFDVAITDLRMPGMDGIETLTSLKTLDPALEVIVATGYATDETAGICKARGAHGFLRKPYVIADLVTLLESALRHKQAAV